MELWYLHPDGVSAVSGRGPVDDAPEERGYFLRRVARAAVGRLIDDAGKGGAPPGLPSCVRSPIGISRGTSSSPLAPALTAVATTPRRHARANATHPRSRNALRSSADNIRWLPRPMSAAASRKRIASEILAGARPGAVTKALRPVASCMRARFPITLQEHGLSAYLFYAGAKYERKGRIVDTFDNVRAAAAPVLEEGIEFLKPSNEPGHQSTRTA